MTSGFNLGNAYGRIVISDNVDEAMRGAQQAFDRGIKGMGQSMQVLGDKITGIGSRLTALTAPLTAFGATGLRAAADFDSAMAEISARTGLVGDDLAAIGDAAKQMGADTVFSAQDAANAFLELLSSGQSAEEALVTLPHVLNAAAAGGMDLGTAADAVTDIMAAFQLNVSDAESVVNSLAQASASSSADIISLQQGFANVGPVANQFGLDVEQTSAILAIFAENGIKGAEAGTQLRSMLLNMTRPTEDVQETWAKLGVSMYDTQGNVRDLGDVMQDLRVVMESGRFTQEEMNEIMVKLGGSYGIMGLTALTTGGSIEDMTALMHSQTDAATVANARMDTMAGAANSLMGSIQTLQITALTPFMNNFLKPAVQRMTEVINKITEWAAANPELTTKIVAMGTALVALGPALVALGIGISTVGKGIQGLSLIMKAFTLGPIGLLLGAIAALVYAFVNDFGGIRTFITGVVDDLLEQFGGLEGVIAAISDIAGKALKEAVKFGKGVLAALQPIVMQVGRFLETVIRDLVSFFQGVVMPALGELVDWVVNRGLPMALDFIKGSVIPLFQSFFRYLGDLWSIVGPGLQTFADWFLTMALPQIIQVIEQSALPLMRDIFGFVGQVWEIVGPALLRFADWFMGTGLPAILAFISTYVIPGIQFLIESIRVIWEKVSPFLLKLLDWFINRGLPLALDFISATAIPAIQDLINILKDVWEAVAPVIQSLVDWFVTTGWPVIQDVIDNIIMPGLDLLIGLLGDIWNAASPHLESLVNFWVNTLAPVIGEQIQWVIDRINDFISVLETLWGIVEEPLNILKDGMAAVFNFIKDNIIQPVLDAISSIGGAISDATGALNDLKADMAAEGNREGLFGSGIGPDFDPLGGIRGIFDSGGYAAPNSIAEVGPTQMGREAFLVGDRGGTFYPDFAQNLGRIAAGIMASQQVAPMAAAAGGGAGGRVAEGALSRPSGGDTFNVTVYANSEAEGRAAARGFREEMEMLIRRRG